MNTRHPRRRAGAASVITMLTVTACATQGAGSHDAADPGGFRLVGVSEVEQVAQLTGADAVTDTTEWGVHGTDLGSMFEAGGKVWFVFGDTFGSRPAGMDGAGGDFWRSNVLAYTTDSSPGDGITLDGMIVDDFGMAREILPSRKADGIEMTVIPTHGFEAGGSMYLHFMSVRTWNDPGEWDANHAGLARSDDGGHTWEVLDEPRWDGDSGFIQISPVTVARDGTDWLYVWGVGAGRFGGVRLARVPVAEVEDPAAWQYFAGTDDDEPQWSSDEADAQIVVDEITGELSVLYNKYLDRWIMMTLREHRGVVIREGLTPWGPWSEDVTVIPHTDLPGPYAPFMLDRFTEDGGRVVYFALSVWGPYNVFWYRLELDRG